MKGDHGLVPRHRVFDSKWSSLGGLLAGAWYRAAVIYLQRTICDLLDKGFDGSMDEADVSMDGAVVGYCLFLKQRVCPRRC